MFAISLIEDFIKTIDDFKVYERDFKTQSAVERQLAIIGEALNQIKKCDPLVAVGNTKKIIGMRNRLVHAYDSIDNAMVCAILNKHLSKLKDEITELLGQDKD